MPKPFELMSIEELEFSYAFWDLKVRQATTWGYAMAEAEDNRQKAEQWLTIRRRENRNG